jgi:hypothetical protein
MSRVSFSNENLEMEDVLDYYHLTKEAVLIYKENIRKGIYSTSNSNVPNIFIGMNLEELEEYFRLQLEELEKSVCFSLLSSVEAKLRVDFLKRVYNRDKDDISRVFRQIHKEKGTKISLEEDILENWKLFNQDAKHYIGAYRGALNYRHWLAHGRYWLLKSGRTYDFPIVYSISLDMINNLNLE